MPQAPIRKAPQKKRPVTARGPVDWESAVEAFLAAKASENLSPSTLTNYRQHLLSPRANTFREDHGLTYPGQLHAEHLEELQRELLGAGVSPSLTHAYHRVWKNFLHFCADRGYGVDEDVLKVKAPKLPRVEPETFTAIEERKLLEAVGNARDRLIIELMIRTGLRLSEVANLRMGDIVDGPDGAYLRVRHGKGGKDRIVPIDTAGYKLSTKLRNYMRNERVVGDENERLFLTSRLNGGIAVPLTARGLQIMLYRLGQKTGIHVHPHKFRHTFATRALSAGVDVMALQRVLGHTTLAMVSRYVHYQKDDLLAAWQRRRD